jgi:hypothetical protein
VRCVLEWHERNDEVMVRRAGRYTSEDVHRAAFTQQAVTGGGAVKEGVRKYLRKRHARG